MAGWQQQPGPRDRKRTHRLAGGVLVLLLLGSAGTAAAASDSGFGAGRLWLSEASLGDASPEAREWRARHDRVNVGKALLAALGAGLLGWGAWQRRRGHEPRGRRLRDRGLALLGVLGFAAWWNFGLFHYPDFVHPHELFHYVIGAKYFPELGYTRLYECAVIADVEAGLGDAVARREIVDLHSYGVVPAAELAAHPERCTDHFTPERWTLFQHDMTWFRSRMALADWEGLQRDHGYNPTPVWGILGRLFVGSSPLFDARIATLSLIDPLLELLLWGFAFWGFGWRAGCVALLFWGTNHPAEYGWVGGAYLRHDWLLASVAGMALLRRGSAGAGGFLLGWAALLRVFPLIFFVPFALRAVVASLRARKLVIEPSHARVAAGALLAAAVALPLSLWSTGTSAWPEFAVNVRLHATLTSNTTLGIGSLIAFSPQSRETTLRAAGADVDAAWKRARRENRSTRWPLFALLAAALIALTARAARAAQNWELAILGVGLVPVFVDASSYYSAAFLAYGFLAARQPVIGAALCLLSLAGWAAAARWLAWDDISVATSAALLVFVATAAVCFKPDTQELES